MKVQNYNDELLYLAEDLALRMLPAFDTPTGLIHRILLIFYFFLLLSHIVLSYTFHFLILSQTKFDKTHNMHKVIMSACGLVLMKS
jgi:hypothetical protein